MIEFILISILLLGFLCLLFYVWRIKKRHATLLRELKRHNHGDTRKIFTQGKSIESEIIFQINQIIENCNTHIIEYKRNEENNKELLTSLSHDIRTPISSLIGYVDALVNDMLSEQEEKEYLGIVQKKAYDLKTYINVLFDWFKINSHEMFYHFEMIDINELTRQLIIEWLSDLHSHSVTLTATISDDILLINLDIDAYKRIIHNLVHNALTHGLCKNLAIKITKQANTVKVDISDDGKGISSENIAYIFNRLYKCESSRNSKGSGLGLSIVKELMNVHHGSVEVKSIPCECTIFTLIFPS